MHRLILSVFLLFSALQIPAPADERFTAKEAMGLVLTDFIRPGYQALDNSARNFQDAVNRLCAAPDKSALIDARKKFSNLVANWGEIEMIRFGPILGDNLLERFFFFPDRRGSGLKRIRKLLLDRDAKALDADQLTTVSVAAQGLGAAEYVLFGKGSDKIIEASQRHRCGYAKSLAQNINSITKILNDEWNGEHDFIYMWGNPGYRNPVFAADDTAIAHLISTIVHGLEVARDVRIAAFLKSEAGQDRPKSAPLWRSSNTIRLIRANVISVKKIYQISNLHRFLPADKMHIAASTDALFDEFLNASILETNIADALSETQSREKLVRMREIVDRLIITMDNKFAGTLGLSVGFFFDDGD